MINYQTITIDLQPDYREPVVQMYLSERDVGRPIQVNVLMQGQPYSFIAGTTVHIDLRKPSGHVVQVNGNYAVGSNVVLFNVVEQMAAEPGMCLTELSIIGDGQDPIGSKNWLTKVEISPMHAGDPSETWIEDLDELVQDAMEGHIDATLSIPGDAADAAAVGEELADLQSALDNTNKVIALSKNALEMEWEEGSITMNGTKVASTAHRRTAYCIRLAKGSQLICSDGVKVRVVTFTMLYPYSTVLDTATDYVTSYTANSDQYAMFAINSTDTSKIAIVAPYQYKREYTNLSPDIWTEGRINTSGNIVAVTGKYYTVPFYVGAGTYFECVGDTKFRVLCFDEFDIKNRKLISRSDDWVGFYTVPQNCFVQIVLSPQYDDEAITPADFGKLHAIIVSEDNHGLRLQWELGGITLATGTDNTSNYRYRTLFFKAKAGDYIGCRSGYTMVVYEYTKDHPQNMRLITSNSSWVSSYVVRTDCICRLAVKKDDGTQVVVSNLQTMITITSSENNNRLLNAKKTFNVPSPEYKSASLVPQGIWTVTYEDVYSWYDALVDNAYVTKETLGNDQSGTYPIHAYRFKPISVGASFVSQNSETVIPVKAYPIKFLLCTATHGSERPSVLALYNAMYNVVNHWMDDPVLEFIRHNCEIVVVPLVNPYGFVNRTRGNFNGVDINRNYNTNSWQYGISDTSSPYYRGTAAASEAETRRMQNMIMSEPFDFVYDFHTHGNFTAYDQMFCWASCGNGFKELSFEIGQAVTKSTNASAIKNYGYDNTKMIGRNEVYADYAMIADFADKFCYASGSPEVSYKLYDGNGSINSDAELTDAVKATNEEYIINSIIMSANSMH